MTARKPRQIQQVGGLVQVTVTTEVTANRMHVVAGLRGASPEGEAAFLAAIADKAIPHASSTVEPRNDPD